MATCGQVWKWMVQILLWGSMVFFIVSLIIDSDTGLFYGALSTLLSIYFMYLITVCCSNTCSYLMNKKKNTTIHSYMVNLFKANPKVSYSVQCYHYETRTYTTTDSNGNTSSHTETYRVDTFSDTEEFVYSSVKDVSGVFIMDMNKVILDPKKYYIKLHLTTNIYPSNDGTDLDYKMRRDAFYDRNRYRDQHMDTHEHKTIPNYTEFNMVSVGEQRPFGINWPTYFFISLLGFAELYKMYTDHFCVSQDFTICKEFSTRRDLNSQEFSQGFIDRLPSIRIKDDVIVMDDPAQIFVPSGSGNLPLPKLQEENGNLLDSKASNLNMNDSDVNLMNKDVIPMTNQTPAEQIVYNTSNLPSENDLQKNLLDNKKI